MAEVEHLLAYRRIHDQEILLILINFDSREVEYQESLNFGEVIFEIGEFRRSAKGGIIISPFSGLIITEKSILNG